MWVLLSRPRGRGGPVNGDPQLHTPTISPLVRQNDPVFHVIHTPTTSTSSFLK